MKVSVKEKPVVLVLNEEDVFFYFGSQWLKINPYHTFSKSFAAPKPKLAIIQENVDWPRHSILECLMH